MKLRILPSAKQDLDRGQEFYARQGGDSLGDYFLDSLFSDIDSLQLYAGVHAKIFGYYRTGQTVSLRRVLQGGWRRLHCVARTGLPAEPGEDCRLAEAGALATLYRADRHSPAAVKKERPWRRKQRHC